MITGRRPFDGATTTDVISAIIRADPDWDALPQETPASVVRLLHHCLHKDPRERLRDIADARLDLTETAGAPSVPSARRDPPSLLRWAVVAVLVAALPFTWAYPRRSDGTPLRTQFAILPPSGTLLPGPPGRLAISPNGHLVVFGVRSGLSVRLTTRDVGSGAVRELPDSEGVTSKPFWSPDSQWVAFATGAKLRRVNPATGASQMICDLPGVVGGGSPLLQGETASGTWNRDGTILFSVGTLTYGSARPLFRVPATGGQPIPFTSLDSARDETEHAFPEFLPDGRHFLFLVRRKGLAPEIVAASLDDPGMRKPVLDKATRAIVVGAHIVYARRGVLYTQPFDTKTIAVSGEAVALASDVASTALSDGIFAASERGLAFENRRNESAPLSQFTWFDRAGRKLGTLGTAAEYVPNFSITRDGRRLAFLRAGDVWAFDAQLDTQLRITTDPALDNDPIWSPDGSRIMFDSPRGGTWDVFVKTVGSTAPESVVLATDRSEFVEEWSPDGRYAVLVLNSDLVALSLADGHQIPITQDDAHQDEPHFSPDGKRLAYSSNESGVPEIYVTAFPPTGVRRLVSTGIGVQPRWSADGRELYYLTLDGAIMSVRLDSKTSSPIAAARPLFQTKLTVITDIWDQYDVTNDGRFLVLEPVGPPNAGAITVIANWAVSDTQR
jgi:Tol biopolymer transport system component